jgi:hypothetical protein
VPGFGSSTLNNGQSLAVGWTRTLGPRMVNDFRFGFNRLRAGIFQEHQGNDVSASLGITGLLTDPNAVGRPGVVVGITDPLLEATNLPQDRKDKTLQFNDSLSWLLGRHSLKTGVDVRHFALDFYLDVIARGQFVFVGLSGNRSRICSSAHPAWPCARIPKRTPSRISAPPRSTGTSMTTGG